MDTIQPIDLPSWETGLHSERVLYPEPNPLNPAPAPDPEIEVINS